jgi:hypothetical protein
LISRAWSNPQTQEILQNNLETDVYTYIIDKIDDLRYDPMDHIMPLKSGTSDQVSMEENDFVIDIIEKERQFNAELGQKEYDDSQTAQEIKEAFKLSQIQKVASVSDVIALETGRTSFQNSQESFKKVTKVNQSSQKQKSTTKSQKKVSGTASSGEISDSQKEQIGRPTAFFIPSTLPPVPGRPNQAMMQVSPKYDLRQRKKGSKMADQMYRDAQTYDSYKGQEDPFYKPAPEPGPIQPQDVLDTAFKHYFGERAEYLGKFDPTQDAEQLDDPGYERYKKIFVVRCMLINRTSQKMRNPCKSSANRTEKKSQQ